ncbi:hypothetical protein NC652_002120 [Populus alba x Populus x berolinensis]|nr:hypothetical protein NC652_002120 [Populus alba x Populus x berolinensis]
MSPDPFEAFKIPKQHNTRAEGPGVDANGSSFDFTTKLLHLAWHPTENSIACAAANSLYMY